MTWQGIEGHDDVLRRFQTAYARGRLASTFLFLGPEGIGKKSFALKLAQALLCQNAAPGGGDAAPPETLLQPCGRCPSCIQVTAGSHPDVHLVARLPERSVLLVEQFIGTLAKRGQEGLCHEIALKPLMGGRRVAIIDDADYLHDEGANALLKTLEEPPPNSVMMLIGTSAEAQLPTIRSRCQTVFFRPLATEALARVLLRLGIASDAAQAAALARRAGGSVSAARELADEALWEFRVKLLRQLAEPCIDSVPLGAETAAFIDSAGKEAPVRRARARHVFGFAEEFFRQLHRGASGAPLEGDEVLLREVERALPRWRGGAESAAACVRACLDAAEQIPANANLVNIVWCWMDDVAHIAAGGKPLPAL